MTAAGCEGVVEPPHGAPQEAELGPPVGDAVLVLVAVVEAVEDLEHGDQGVCDLVVGEAPSCAAGRHVAQFAQVTRRVDQGGFYLPLPLKCLVGE